MANLLDLLKTSARSFHEALGQSNPDSVFDKIVADLSLAECPGIEDNEVTKGSEVFSQWERKGSLADQCHGLIFHCGDYDNGLELLKNASDSHIKSAESRRKFFDHLTAYARLLGNQPVLVSGFGPLSPVNAVDLGFLDQSTSSELQRVLEEMRRPGQPFALQASDWPPKSPAGEDEALRASLIKCLQTCTPEVVAEFRQRLEQPACEETKAFLLILVEPSVNAENEACYQFRAELVMEGGDVASFAPGRERDGHWPKGSIELFPSTAGQWMSMAQELIAKTTPLAKLYMEIFLPVSLLSQSPNLQIQVNPGSGWETMDLCACGVPAVLRFLDRPQTGHQFGLFQKKWERLRGGQAKLHTVFNGAQLQPSLLRPRLFTDQVAGLLMLLDLPAELENRHWLFWQVIDAGLPFCGWWRTSDHPDPEVQDASPIDERLKNLQKCLELPEFPLNLEDDPRSPPHLHGMEHAADQRAELAGKPSCAAWISKLMLLIDHPQRWPKCILFQNELGGSNRSPA